MSQKGGKLLHLQHRHANVQHIRLLQSLTKFMRDVFRILVKKD